MTENRGNGTKGEWRALAKGAFALIPAASRRRLDEALGRRLTAILAKVGGGTLLGFSPLPDEPDITGILRRWLSEGGTLAMPVWTGGAAMVPRRVENLDRDLAPGRAGIMEPLAALPECGPDGVKAALVPGRAFSEDGTRLGRGAGCYDALLAGRDILKIGVAYDFQVFPELPGDERDIRMDMVATPGRLIGA